MSIDSRSNNLDYRWSQWKTSFQNTLPIVNRTDTDRTRRNILKLADESLVEMCTDVSVKEKKVKNPTSFQLLYISCINKVTLSRFADFYSITVSFLPLIFLYKYSVSFPKLLN